MKKWFKRLCFRLRFAWFLWHDVKYDGLGNKIEWWIALPWAWDLKWWGFNPQTLEREVYDRGEDHTQNNAP